MATRKEEELHRKELGIKEFEEPEACVKCGSTDPMEYNLVSDGHGLEDRPAWICDACGHTHLEAHDDDWFCAKCNYGPHSDADDKCRSCGTPVNCDPTDGPGYSDADLDNRQRVGKPDSSD